MMSKRNIFRSWYFITVVVILTIILVSGLYIYIRKDALKPPEIKNFSSLNDSVVTVDDNFSYIGNSWLRKRSEGMYELYVEGEPFQRGVYIGKLTKKLVQFQEEVFVEKISEYIPSDRYRTFLNTLISVFNADLDDFIPVEYQKEIYGISFNASHKFDAYGSPYQRQLNYHGAHDIGHMMQNYMLVGCSSFTVWNEHTLNGKLYSARNFDFYFGDKFSQNKIVQFVSPDKGYNFAFITWGGMIGVVSGMNQEGLSITVNAGTPVIPLSTGTPVSILAREILQYARTIDEAVAIAKQYKLFVSESFHITSAADSTAIIIEKTPNGMDVVKADSTLLVCTNFYQSDMLKNTEDNISNKERNASFYRYKRIKELVKNNDSLDYSSIVAILRNRNGLHNASIGNGNEKAINQLLAHHGIVFSLYDKTFWISTSPSILGGFVAYNLDSVFTNYRGLKSNKRIEIDSLYISHDAFLDKGINDYILYKMYRTQVLSASLKNPVNEGQMREFIALNPRYFEAYKIAGDYYFRIEDYRLARKFYTVALDMEINAYGIVEEINKKIEDCNDNL